MFTGQKIQEILDTFKGPELALHRAVILNEGGRDFFSGIVKFGFKLDEYAPDGTTAMHWAAKLGRQEALKEFIEHGKVDIYMQDKNGKTFFDYAKEYRDNNIQNQFSGRTLSYLENRVIQLETEMKQKVETLQRDYQSLFVALKSVAETVTTLISKPDLEDKDYLALETQCKRFAEFRERFLKFQKEYNDEHFKLYAKNQNKMSEMQDALVKDALQLTEWEQFIDRASILKPKPKTEAKSDSDLLLKFEEMKKQMEAEKTKHEKEIAELREALKNQTNPQSPLAFSFQPSSGQPAPENPFSIPKGPVSAPKGRRPIPKPKDHW